MRELKENDGFKGFYDKPSVSTGKYTVICSANGSIVYSDEYLKELSGRELSGRNIGSLLDYRVKADVISAYNDGQRYNANVNLFGKKFNLISAPEGKYITITLTEKDFAQEGVIIDEKDYEGLSSEIRTALYSIIGMMRDPEFKGNARIGAARKDFFRTYRTINALLEKISFENELNSKRAQRCDIDGVCRGILEKIKEYGGGYSVGFSTDGADHTVIADKAGLDKAFISLFICLYNSFGFKNSKISVSVKLDSDKVILRAAARNVHNFEEGADAEYLQEDDFLKKEELFVAKKLISDNFGLLSSIKEKDKTVVTVSFDKAGKDETEVLKLNDKGRPEFSDAIDSMLLFELGETLSGDDY